ncbi:NAD(P)H-dependent flavin oxidoreductase [Staphylococcus carnosus]|uniref:Probable nitronate monooxygenase n=1 Tax=Staphylococcus carnosus TaxID=1281 RepID=A0AAJ0JN01_STACA|nr:nitronate monooxygenase [Staphylococcus carnosus]KKB24770.1 nitronate monooxygenase [Staphylococcus carnosus]POA02701.1 nitronate monooxygenase [Staphylococcus carnosus]QQS85800.1 nitronate monooxygenase [Staphylococcus carnosus]QRQ05737.1 nitronate monooxygenase [Staphylococcus carnosus]UTB82266.1 nitronate monooxygenase [Staphylococcus carnosus]
MWSDTKVSKQLGIKYPIIQAGMAGNTTPELVAHVSESDGLGTIGAGYFGLERLEEEIDAVKQLTSQPFAVNLFVPNKQRLLPAQVDLMNAWLSPYRRALNLENPVINLSQDQLLEAQIDILIKKEVPIASFTFGIPDKYLIRRMHEHDIVVMGTATSVAEAAANETAGVDIIVTQGSEAGGHRGSFMKENGEYPMVGNISLIPQVADAVSIPIVAAGGIMDGRGVLASMILGASGVQMGTAFLTSQESGADIAYKEAILNSTDTSTVLTNAFSGKMARGIRNDFINYLSEFNGEIPDYPIQNQLTSGIRKASTEQHNDKLMSLWSGQTPRLATNRKASKIINTIVDEIEEMNKNGIRR